MERFIVECEDPMDVAEIYSMVDNVPDATELIIGAIQRKYGEDIQTVSLDSLKDILKEVFVEEE